MDDPCPLSLHVCQPASWNKKLDTHRNKLLPRPRPFCCYMHMACAIDNSHGTVQQLSRRMDLRAQVSGKYYGQFLSRVGPRRWPLSFRCIRLAALSRPIRAATGSLRGRLLPRWTRTRHVPSLLFKNQTRSRVDLETYIYVGAAYGPMFHGTNTG